MKPKNPEFRVPGVMVAPRAGAWIETLFDESNYYINPVAPRAGAWIETSPRKRRSGHACVAPRAGAWIETQKTS